MVWASSRRSALRAIRAESARIVAFALGLALIVGVVRGGSHYWYCPFMDAVVTEHCCAETHDDASTFRAPDCCETLTIGTLPSVASVRPVPPLPPSGLTAMLPAAQGIGAGATAAARALPYGPRLTGPPLARVRRATRSMVFLI